MHAPPCQNQNPPPHVQSNCQHHTHDMTMETRTNDMMASQTSSPSFTCQYTCYSHRHHDPSIARPDPPSRRRKKGPRGSLGSVSYPAYQLTPRHLRVQITGLSTRGPPPYPERGGSGPASRPLGAPVLHDSSDSCWAGRSTLVSPPVGRILGLSNSVGDGQGRGLGFGWRQVFGVVAGAASAGDVVVAPFSLIPSSFRVEEVHSQ